MTQLTEELIQNWELDPIHCGECGDEETFTCCATCKSPLCGSYDCVKAHVARHLAPRDAA